MASLLVIVLSVFAMWFFCSAVIVIVTFDGLFLMRRMWTDWLRLGCSCLFVGMLVVMCWCPFLR